MSSSFSKSCDSALHSHVLPREWKLWWFSAINVFFRGKLGYQDVAGSCELDTWHLTVWPAGCKCKLFSAYIFQRLGTQAILPGKSRALVAHCSPHFWRVGLFWSQKRVWVSRIPVLGTSKNLPTGTMVFLSQVVYGKLYHLLLEYVCGFGISFWRNHVFNP